ncbi:extracellular solute-binding protein [Paenibacillus glucanolyticus]|uniref:extracellular solute-binding protein n=1 Tax=Paenibacillus TaxID=44249 RepID=UPI0011634B3E|nr:extracellular solute-binding protein [Paenibacillus sp. Cedars]AWP27719.1 ABC transporter substrate-binding protein [Paenibacillus sp. Cedars]
MRKPLSLLVVFMFMMSIVAACSSSNEPTTGNVVSPADTDSKNKPGETAQPAQGGVFKFDEKKTFTMLTESHASWPYDKEWLIWDLIEEYTNATVDVEVPAGTIGETLSLTIAGGDLPDLMYMPNYALANRYGSEGALANILDYVDLMPNFKKWMEQYPEQTQMALAADGSMYIFPNEGFGQTNRMVWLYREDIFSKHGLKSPANYDELYDVLKQLKELYPDSYPLSFRGGFQRLLNMAVNFDTSNKLYYNFESKEWKYGPIEDNFKLLVEYLNKFYKEGFIPPDFLTMDAKAWQDMMSTNRSFMSMDYIGRIDFFNVPLRADNPEFNLANMAPPAGKLGGKQLNPHLHYVQSGMTVASTSNQIEDVMRYMDFFYSEEGRIAASWGKEGVTFTTENGKKKMLPEFVDVSDLRKKTGLATNGTYAWIDYDAHLSLSSQELQAAYGEAEKYDSPMQPMPALTHEELETNTTISDSITKRMEQSIANFILGELSLDQWDQYVKQIEDLGLQQLIDIHTTAHQRILDAQ